MTDKGGDKLPPDPANDDERSKYRFCVGTAVLAYACLLALLLATLVLIPGCSTMSMHERRALNAEEACRAAGIEEGSDAWIDCKVQMMIAAQQRTNVYRVRTMD